MTDIDLDFEEPSERSMLDKVNDALKANSPGDTITVQDIAEKFDITPEALSIWAATDESFQEGLEKFRTLQDQGTVDELENRLDAGIIAMLLLETKKKHE